MYRVLIADDEKTVTESLVRSVKWQELGLEVAGIARNGYEAIGMLEIGKIDIAILDIRMPGIDGLELCRIAKEKNKKIRVLIISGYAEFAYAQKAILYGVLGYCLKPLDYTEVTKYLLKAVHELEREGETMRRDLLEACLERDSFTVSLILQKNGFLGSDCFVAASVGTRPFALPAGEGITVLLGKGLWGYLMKSCYFAGKEESFFAKEAQSGIGYLAEAVSETDIFDALEQCAVMSYQYFLDEKCRMCTSLDDGNAGEWLDEVQQCVKNGKWGIVLNKLMEIKVRHAQDFTVKSALRLSQVVYSGDIFQENVEDYYIYEISQLIAQYESFAKMIEELCRSICDARDKNDGVESSGNRSFLRILDYVDRNYRENLSLGTVAGVLHMNATYISQLFKKESGVTFVQYVTQKRLDDAKELLATTQMPIADIAMDVGFHDYFYFQKTFKRLVGVSPGQYRQELPVGP